MSKSDVVRLVLGAVLSVADASAQNSIPANLADSVLGTLGFSQRQMIAVAEAMPEDKYSFIPTDGSFKESRSFGEQVKHVACAHFAFYNQIEGKTPPEACERGGPAPAKTKAELVQYLRESFSYGNRVLQTISAENALSRVEGRYAGPNTRLGMAVTSVWHLADHYGQLVLYLRMNGIVPPASQRDGLKVR